MARKRSELGSRPSEYRRFTDRTWARMEFLSAIEKVAQKVLTALKRDVLPVLTAMNVSSRPDFKALGFDRRLQEPLLEALRDDIASWASVFHLSDQQCSTSHQSVNGLSLNKWMENVILETLLYWVEHPRTDKPLRW